MAQRNMNAVINVGFENAAERQLPVSGENLSTLFGKLGKYCADLKPVAFSGNYADLTGRPDTAPLDTSCTLLASSWTGAAAPYTQTVNVTGILATDKPILDVSVSDTVATGVSETEQWANITKATAGAGAITFSCYEEKPDIDLTVNVKVVR